MSGAPARCSTRSGTATSSRRRRATRPALHRPRLIHEGSRHAFRMLEASAAVGRAAEADLRLHRSLRAVAGPRAGVAAIADEKIRDMVELLEANTSAHGIMLFGIDDPRQGIVHVVGPEQGITQPGMVIVRRRLAHLDARRVRRLAFGIGASEILHVLATQTLWQRRPKTLRITVDGTLGSGVSAKDVILAIIGQDRHRRRRRARHRVRRLDHRARCRWKQRMTVCNMSIEAGARAGMIAPDDTTFAYLEGRPFAPKGAQWDEALAFWRRCPPTPDAAFDQEIDLDARDIAPMVTWGTNPEHALPITGAVPDPAASDARQQRAEIEAALAYMGLTPGTPLDRHRGRPRVHRLVHQRRIEDLRAAADVARLGRAPSRRWVVPGSTPIKRQAEAEGLDRIFTARRLRMARRRLLAVHRDQRRSARARRALRLDVEPQLPRTPGPERPHPSHEPRDGRGCRGHRPPHRRAHAAAARLTMEPFRALTAIAAPIDEVERRHQPALPDPLQQGAARHRLRAHPLPRPAFRRRGQREARFHPESRAVPPRPHHRRGAQLRLRLVARKRGLRAA